MREVLASTEQEVGVRIDASTASFSSRTLAIPLQGVAIKDSTRCARLIITVRTPHRSTTLTAVTLLVLSLATARPGSRPCSPMVGPHGSYRIDYFRLPQRPHHHGVGPSGLVFSHGPFPRRTGTGTRDPRTRTRANSRTSNSGTHPLPCEPSSAYHPRASHPGRRQPGPHSFSPGTGTDP